MEAAAVVGRERRVGIIYDERMCKHHTHDGEPHPENPDRIKVIWDKLQAAGITQRLDFSLPPVIGLLSGYRLLCLCLVGIIAAKVQEK